MLNDELNFNFRFIGNFDVSEILKEIKNIPDEHWVQREEAGRNGLYGDGKFVFDTIPMPVQKVNYVIQSLNVKQGSEYIVLEVWTDGSVSPQETVQFALKNLTSLFYQFAADDVLEVKWQNNSGYVAVATYAETPGVPVSPAMIVTLQQIA